MSTPELKVLQAGFQAFILREADSPPPGLHAVGAAVYAEAYVLRLTEALASDCPALRQLLGEAGFAAMASAYALASPSRHFSVRWFGRDLAGFLRGTAPFSSEPYLAELATFEWLMGEAFDSADAPTIGPDRLAVVPAADWPVLTLGFHPSVRRLDARHDVTALWRRCLSGNTGSADGLSVTPVHVVVWRRGLEVYFRSLAPAEATSLDSLLRGETFTMACEHLAAAAGPGTDAAAQIASGLRRWLDEGLIACIGVPQAVTNP